MANSAFPVAGTINGGGNYQALSQQIASNSPSLNFGSLSASFIKYILTCTNVIMGTASASLKLTANADASGLYQFSWGFTANNGSQGIGAYGANDTAITLITTMSNVNPADLDIEIYNPSASSFTGMTFDGTYINAEGTFANLNGGGYYANNVPVTSIQVFPSSGVITSGIFTLFGITGP